MDLDVYRKTLRDLRGQALVWGAGVVLLAAANVLVIPTIRSMTGFADFLDSLPEVIKSLAGDVRAMATPTGFLRIKLLDPLPLLLAIFGVAHGAQALAGEAEHRTLDLLLAQPVPRGRVVVQKFLAVATVLLLLCGLVAATLAATAAAMDLGLRGAPLAWAALAGWPLGCLFAALAVLGSCALRRARHAAAAAGAFVVAAYTWDSLMRLSPVLARWEPLSLFHLHRASFTMDGQLAAGPPAVLLALTAAVVALAAAVFARRDLTG